MANVPHSALTGADLHESKGTAAATANTVFVADGAGSGTFQKVPLAAITGLVNPFGAQLLHAYETSAPALGAGAYTRALVGTLTNEIAGASLASNQITLPAGTYFVEAEASTWRMQGGYHQLRLFNLTTSSALVSGLWSYFESSNYVTGLTTNGSGGVTGWTPLPPNSIPAILKGRFTLAGTSNVILQSNVGSGSMAAYSSGNSAQCLIWKVA